MLLVDLRAGFTMLVDSDVGFLLLKDAMVLAVQQGPRMTPRVQMYTFLPPSSIN
jgi:hypothetical protein